MILVSDAFRFDCFRDLLLLRDFKGVAKRIFDINYINTKLLSDLFCY